MFGFSFGEIFLLLVVGIVVVGPKRLPAMMRTAGQWVARLRRMSTDLRSQSGIDELIRIEGLEREMQELRALTRVNIVQSIMSPVIQAAEAAAAPPMPRPLPAVPAPLPQARAPVPVKEPLREREYPLIGCDSYDALPDDTDAYRDKEAREQEEAKAKETKAAAAPIVPDDAPVPDSRADDDPSITAHASSDPAITEAAEAEERAQA